MHGALLCDAVDARWGGPWPASTVQAGLVPPTSEEDDEVRAGEPLFFPLLECELHSMQLSSRICFPYHVFHTVKTLKTGWALQWLRKRSTLRATSFSSVGTSRVRTSCHHNIYALRFPNTSQNKGLLYGFQSARRSCVCCRRR